MTGVCSRVCNRGVHELLPGRLAANSSPVGPSRQFPRHQEVYAEVRCLSARKSRFLEGEPGLCVFQLDPLLTPARAQEEGHPEGPKKTAECAFAKRLGIQHGAGGLSISVSNRQQPMVAHFGTHRDDRVSNHLRIARALFNGDAGDTVTQLQISIDELEAANGFRRPSIED
jgi:hypothetical protein